MNEQSEALLAAFLVAMGGNPDAANLYIAGLCNGIRLTLAEPDLARWAAGVLEYAIGAGNGTVGEQAEQANRGAAEQLIALVRAVKED